MDKVQDRFYTLQIQTNLDTKVTKFRKTRFRVVCSVANKKTHTHIYIYILVHTRWWYRNVLILVVTVPFDK